MKIAVLGVGAIGSCIGADLTRAGYDILLIDQWPDHVEAMKRDGLNISIADAEFNVPVRAAHLCELPVINEQFDIVLLTCKSYDSCWMAELIKPHFKPRGVLVSIQNSMNNEWLIPIIGYQKNIGCVVELSAELFEPGRIKRNTDSNKTWFALGELHGHKTARLTTITEVLSNAGRVDITTNIWGAKWTKLIANSMMQAVSGLLGLPDYEATSMPGVFDICIQTGREATAVGIASGYEIEAIYGLSPDEFTGSTDEMLKKNLKTLTSHIGKKSLNSVLQDHLKGRYNEVDFLNGLIVKKGKETGVQTPVNLELVRLTNMIRNKEITPSIDNINLVRNAAANKKQSGT